MQYLVAVTVSLSIVGIAVLAEASFNTPLDTGDRRAHTRAWELVAQLIPPLCKDT